MKEKIVTETVICPKCGQPFPKKRQELGYNYCCNCSTEKKLVSITEGGVDGDDTHTLLHIVKPEAAATYYSNLNQTPIPDEFMKLPENAEVVEQANELALNNLSIREARFEALEAEAMDLDSDK